MSGSVIEKFNLLERVIHTPHKITG